jgi:DNA-binding response OmpR family regulator
MQSENLNVLVVEDEDSIRKFITINLKRNGFDVVEAESGERALSILQNNHIEVVILDIMLPGMDGFKVCESIRKSIPNMIIIMLTARSEDMDKILGLELGADDYMIKPFNPLELVARIRAIIRRTNTAFQDKSIIKSKDFTLDLKAQKFYKSGREIDLTPTEYSIIKTFMEDPGMAFSRDELLNTVWGKNYFGDIKTVDVHIRRLREKIEDNPSKPKIIETVWGFGYRWMEDK